MENFINSILEQMSSAGLPQKKFLITLFLTMLLMRGKVRFRNLSRYSDLSEKTYSRQFRRTFDFADYNERLIEDAVPSDHEKTGAMDCSYIPKSGKKTYGPGFFYDSGCDKPAKGLEISDSAVIDVTDNTGYSLSNWQTPPQEEIEKLIAERGTVKNKGKEDKDKITGVDFYAEHLRRDTVCLPQDVNCLVADGYYTKVKFVNAVREADLHMAGKFRCDADLRYLYDGPQKKFGARRKYDGKVKFDDLSRLEYVTEVDTDIHLHTAVVNSVCLKRDIRLVYVLNSRNKKKPGYALLFSTDTEPDAETVYRYYKARFQIEFLFRDA